MLSWRVLLWIVVVMFDPSSSETLTVVLGGDICLSCTNCTDCKYDLESHPELKIEDGCLLIKNANMTHSKSWKCPPNVSYWLEVEIPFQLLDIKSFNEGRIECSFDPGYPGPISSKATLQCQDPGDQHTPLALNRSSVEYYGFQEKHSFSVNLDELDPECRNYTVTCSGAQIYNHTTQTEQKTKVWPNPIWGDQKRTPRTPIEPRVSLSLDNEFNEGRIECSFDPGYPGPISSKATLQCQDPGDQHTTLTLKHPNVTTYGFQEMHSFSMNLDELDPECRNYTVTCVGSEGNNSTLYSHQETKVWANPRYGYQKGTPIEPWVKLRLENMTNLLGKEVHASCFALGDFQSANLTISVQTSDMVKFLSTSHIPFGEPRVTTFKFSYPINRSKEGYNITCQGSFMVNDSPSVKKIDYIPIPIDPLDTPAKSLSPKNITDQIDISSTVPPKNLTFEDAAMMFADLSSLVITVIFLVAICLIIFVLWFIFCYCRKKKRKKKQPSTYSTPSVPDLNDPSYSKLNFNPPALNMLKAGYAKVRGSEDNPSLPKGDELRGRQGAAKKIRKGKTRQPSDVLPPPPALQWDYEDGLSTYL